MKKYQYQGYRDDRDDDGIFNLLSEAKAYVEHLIKEKGGVGYVDEEHTDDYLEASDYYIDGPTGKYWKYENKKWTLESGRW